MTSWSHSLVIVTSRVSSLRICVKASAFCELIRHIINTTKRTLREDRPEMMTVPKRKNFLPVPHPSFAEMKCTMHHTMQIVAGIRRRCYDMLAVI